MGMDGLSNTHETLQNYPSNRRKEMPNKDVQWNLIITNLDTVDIG